MIATQGQKIGPAGLGPPARARKRRKASVTKRRYKAPWSEVFLINSKILSFTVFQSLLPNFILIASCSLAFRGFNFFFLGGGGVDYFQISLIFLIYIFEPQKKYTNIHMLLQYIICRIQSDKPNRRVSSFITLAFFLFLDPAQGSNSAGPIF